MVLRFFSKDRPRKSQPDIFTAVLTGQVEPVAKCIDQGCDINEGYTALDILLKYRGKIEPVALQLLEGRLVLEDINDPKGLGLRMWEWAAFHGHMQTIVALQAMGINMHASSARALRPACYNLDAHLVKHLIHNGASSALRSRGLVDCAMGARDVQNRGPHHNRDALSIMKELISNDSDINQVGYNGRTALSICSRSNLQELVRLLLEHGVDPNLADEDGNSPLHHVAWTTEPLSLTKMLLAAGASTNLRNSQGRTPMDSAARHGSCLENLKLLIALSHPSQLDWDTMLYESSRCGFLEMLEYLLLNGANPTTEIEEDDCALFLVMYRYQDAEKATAMLLEHCHSGAFATRSGTTVLHKIACRPPPPWLCDMIPRFIEKGADLEAIRRQNVEDSQDCVVLTPLWEACLHKIPNRPSELVDKLLFLGANPYIEIAPGKIVLCSGRRALPPILSVRKLLAPTGANV
ncbi:MAG: hypothetical protein Q9213_000869 [Squamulea squamosa]